MPQAAISRMERRTDLLLSTLRQYIEGLGGQLELRAVFPEAEFILEPLAPAGKREAAVSVPSLPNPEMAHPAKLKRYA